MSFPAMGWAANQKVGGPTGKAILLMLASHADRNGVCMPGQSTLADECECSERAVREWLSRLEDQGLIRRETRRRDNGSRTSDRIILNLAEAQIQSPANGAGNQPADNSPEQPAKSAGNQAANIAGNQPAEFSEFTGRFCRAINSQGKRKRVGTDVPTHSEPSGSGVAVAKSEPRSPIERNGADMTGSDEDRFWALAEMLAEKDVPRSMCGKLANLLGGAFDEGCAILRDVAKATSARPYLSKIIKRRQDEERPVLPHHDPSIPPWVIFEIVAGQRMGVFQ